MKPPKNFYNTVDRKKLGLEGEMLPDVSGSDNGKIMKVVEGQWQLAPDAGSDEPLGVEITYEESTYTASESYADIVAALEAGRVVFFKYSDRQYVYAGSNTPGSSDIYFSYIQADNATQIIAKVFSIDEDERITFSEHDINNDTFKRKRYSGMIPASASDPVAVVVYVDYLENDSLVDFYPDVNHVGVYPSSIVYDTSSAQRTVTLTFAAPITAGTFELVVWG